jgi:hypothetical protein
MAPENDGIRATPVSARVLTTDSSRLIAWRRVRGGVVVLFSGRSCGELRRDSDASEARLRKRSAEQLST